MKWNGDSSAKYNQFSVAGDYVLSDRTDVYAIVGYNHASGQNGLAQTEAVTGAFDINSGESSQVLTMISIKHRF